MKLLFVTPEFPFPPLNGFALNTVKHMEHLAEDHDVSLAIVSREGGPEVAVLEERVPSWLTRIYKIKGFRPSLLAAAIDELLVQRPTYYAWNFFEGDLERAFEGEKFDIVIATPAGLGSFCDVYRRVYPRTKCVLMIHDSASRLYADEALRFVQGTAKRTLTSAARMVRLPFILVNERRYLRRFDAVQVQKQAEADYLRHLMGARAPELVVARTGLNDSLLHLPYQALSSRILFMTHLQGGRERQALWFIENIWPQIHAHFAGTFSLVLVGAPAARDVADKIARIAGVVQVGFVQDLTQVFSDKIVSLVPVHQTSGVVTKIIDSMAAGVPVVGFESSLGTIEGLVPGVHAFGVKRKKDFAPSLIRALEAPDKLSEMSRKAREFVAANFSWQEELTRFETALSRLRG